MTYYGIILLVSFAGPFFLSFDKKVAFYKNWKCVFLSTLIVVVPFLIWDAWFTKLHVWGFNQNYSSAIKLVGLPLEEISFFFVVPYCCLFIHEVIKAYFPEQSFKGLSTVFLGFLMAFGIVLIFLGRKNYYTLTACIDGVLLLVLLFVKWRELLGSIGISYLVCLVPFVIVNGLLTGMATDEPVVWYSENHIVGWRLITIPVEDLFYNLCLFLPITLLYERLKNR